MSPLRKKKESERDKLLNLGRKIEAEQLKFEEKSKKAKDTRDETK